VARQVVLLRGVNLGPRNRVAMPALREALAATGFGEVATYVQNGTIVVDSGLGEGPLEARIGELLAQEFGLTVPVTVRTAQELAEVVAGNPIPEAVAEPKRYQVTFTAEEAQPAALARLRELAFETERVEAHGRAVYSWHPTGIARSKLALALTGGTLGPTATARNWTTVTTLLEMATGDG